MHLFDMLASGVEMGKFIVHCFPLVISAEFLVLGFLPDFGKFNGY
jgi:hypothetical protein